jgi:hypothetical protein
MKKLLFAAAALLVAAPAHAYPQWIPVGTESSIDYNSVKDHGNGVRSVVYSFPGSAFTSYYHCPSWQRQTLATNEWEPIVRNTVGETIAYAICPGDMQAAILRVLKTPAPEAASTSELPPPPPPIPTPVESLSARVPALTLPR